MKTGVIDYDAGNLRSVETALRRLGADFIVSSRPEELLATDRLIFPGVGDARAAMEVLARHGLAEAIQTFFTSGRPLLGICLGSQIVLDASEENGARCLGLIPGTAKRFSSDMGMKVPHMGWNQLYHEERHPLLKGIPRGASFYFVHSYYPSPSEREHVYGTTEYGIQFASVIGRENLIAVQFHPEKSGEVGLRMLENFLFGAV